VEFSVSSMAASAIRKFVIYFKYMTDRMVTD
jgi:hypothetical protein